ncbi:MAG: hypothetical protein KF842_12365 [Caulobacter sp.]|nr:hypothetical protein [Caulobacter sp.]
MKRFWMLAAGCSVLALGLTACESRAEYRARRAEREALKVLSKLDCPETQGQLKRQSVAEDGLSCTYAGGDAEVTLRLVAVSDDPGKALAPIEAELRALYPNEIAPPTPPTPPGADAADGEEEDGAAVTTKKRVRLPGVTVEAEEGDGVDRANVKLPGVTIKADGDRAHIKVAGIEINADDTSNEVRITRERWREDSEDDFDIDTSGEDISVNGGGISIGGRRKSGYRSTFIKSDDHTNAPYSAVGYEARGPRSGPLVVAVVKSKADKKSGQSDGLFKDAAALVKHNVGG